LNNQDLSSIHFSNKYELTITRANEITFAVFFARPFVNVLFWLSTVLIVASFVAMMVTPKVGEIGQAIMWLAIALVGGLFVFKPRANMLIESLGGGALKTPQLTYQFSNDRIQLFSGIKEFDFDHGQVRKIVSSPNFYVLVINKNQVIPLEKHSFESGTWRTDNFIDYASEKYPNLTVRSAFFIDSIFS